ncbi:MAG: EamA family transporter [Acidobacteriota bacterium]
MLRVFVVAAIGTLSGALGQILMRRGMQAVGPLESYAVLDILAYFWRSLCNPYVIAGTAMSGILYFAVLAALGWTGVTVAFPMTALEYGFAAMLAVLFLKESVPPLRWLGIAFVIIGVILIGSAGGLDETPASSPSRTHVTSVHKEGDPS